MQNYLDLLTKVLEEGVVKGDRTGTGTISLFGPQMEFDLREGFPLVTTKKMHTKSIIHELLWFISGSTNIQYLQDNNVTIWDEWATPEGEVGALYPHSWRKWPGENGPIDQLGDVIERIKTNPDCRRLVVMAWNPDTIPNADYSPQENVEMGNSCLPPCHMSFQFYTQELTLHERTEWFHNTFNPTVKADVTRTSLTGGQWMTWNERLTAFGAPTHYLSCKMYQRSADLFLGVPFNIGSYSLLMHMVAKLTNTIPYKFIHTFGDAHIYSNHVDQVKLQLQQDPKPLPTLELIDRGQKTIDDFTFDDVVLHNYQHGPIIKAPIAV